METYVASTEQKSTLIKNMWFKNVPLKAEEEEMLKVIYELQMEIFEKYHIAPSIVMDYVDFHYNQPICAEKLIYQLMGIIERFKQLYESAK